MGGHFARGGIPIAINKVLAYLARFWTLNILRQRLWSEYSQKEPQDIIIEALEGWKKQERRKWGSPEPGDIDEMVQHLKKQQAEDRERGKHYKKLKAHEGETLTPEQQKAKKEALRSHPGIAKILDRERENDTSI